MVGASGMESGAKRFEDVGLGLVERRPWCICLLKEALDGSIRGGAVLHSIAGGGGLKRSCSCLL